ncbi:hypothetical protein V1511DRAFT_495457 [Dipodascopsis uninucleata]
MSVEAAEVSNKCNFYERSRTPIGSPTSELELIVLDKDDTEYQVPQKEGDIAFLESDFNTRYSSSSRQHSFCDANDSPVEIIENSRENQTRTVHLFSTFQKGYIEDLECHEILADRLRHFKYTELKDRSVQFEKKAMNRMKVKGATTRRVLNDIFKTTRSNLDYSSRPRIRPLVKRKLTKPLSITARTSAIFKETYSSSDPSSKIASKSIKVHNSLLDPLDSILAAKSVVISYPFGSERSLWCGSVSESLRRYQRLIDTSKDVIRRSYRTSSKSLLDAEYIDGECELWKESSQIVQNIDPEILWQEEAPPVILVPSSPLSTISESRDILEIPDSEEISCFDTSSIGSDEEIDALNIASLLSPSTMIMDHTVNIIHTSASIEDKSKQSISCASSGSSSLENVTSKVHKRKRSERQQRKEKLSADDIIYPIPHHIAANYDSLIQYPVKLIRQQLSDWGFKTSRRKDDMARQIQQLIQTMPPTLWGTKNNITDSETSKLQVQSTSTIKRLIMEKISTHIRQNRDSTALIWRMKILTYEPIIIEDFAMYLVDAGVLTPSVSSGVSSTRLGSRLDSDDYSFNCVVYKDVTGDPNLISTVKEWCDLTSVCFTSRS